eukprot:1161048-Pelagomonas_calceolata.AAC.9
MACMSCYLSPAPEQGAEGLGLRACELPHASASGAHPVMLTTTETAAEPSSCTKRATTAGATSWSRGACVHALKYALICACMHVCILVAGMPRVYLWRDHSGRALLSTKDERCKRKLRTVSLPWLSVGGHGKRNESDRKYLHFGNFRPKFAGVCQQPRSMQRPPSLLPWLISTVHASALTILGGSEASRLNCYKGTHQSTQKKIQRQFTGRFVGLRASTPPLHGNTQTHTYTHLSRLVDQLERADASLHDAWLTAEDDAQKGDHCIVFLLWTQLIWGATAEAAQRRSSLDL